MTQEISEKIDDRLDSIFAMQKGLSEMMNLDRYPKDAEGRVAALCTAIIHEAVELQRTTNWKWWKKPTPFNQSEATARIERSYFLSQESSSYTNPSIPSFFESSLSFAME